MKIPGLVDLQINGYKGVNFSSRDLTQDDFVRACREVFEAGTTAFLPTVITSPDDVYEHSLQIITAVLQREEFRGRLLGVHLEGPFLSAQDGARGAHDAEFIREPDIAYLERLIELSGDEVKLITIAADVEGAEQLARYAVSRGIAVSLGHQMATEEDLDKLARAGAVALTHLGNGVPAMLPRHHNPIWAGLANDDLWAMIITDGHHLPASMLKTIIRAKGPERCVVTSDASPLAGLGPGRYETTGHKLVLEDNGRLWDEVTGYLAASSTTMLQCMNHLASLNLVDNDELVAMGFYNPLELIGVDADDVAPGRDIWFDEKHQLFCVEEQCFHPY
jgi:N-acetylglucosamine-6-phosphate deacetylase